MTSVIKVGGLNGRPLFIDVRIGIRSLRELHWLMLESVYSIKDSDSEILVLLLKCGLTAERLSKEVDSFRSVILPSVGDRLHVLPVNSPDEINETLSSYVRAPLLQSMHAFVLDASNARPNSSSRQDVLFLLLQRWLQGLLPIKTAVLATQCSASLPTVAAALNELSKGDIQRTSDRRVALKGFSPESWQRWLIRSADLPSVKFVDRTRSPSSPQKLAETLSLLALRDVSIGGVLGAAHHVSTIDAANVPCLDLLVHGTIHTDLSFIERLDPGLVRDDSMQAVPHVRVHFTNRHKSHFETIDGVVWADVLDCLVHMWKAGMDKQVEGLISHLTQQAQSHTGVPWAPR